MTTRHIAEKLDIVPATVTMYENVKQPIPYDVAVKLADILEIEASLLYDDFSRFLAVPYTEALKSVRMVLGPSLKAFAEQIEIAPGITISSKEAIADRHERFIRRYALCSRLLVYKLHFYGNIHYNESERKNDWRSCYDTEFDLYPLRRLSYP